MTGLPADYRLRHATLADIPAAQRVLDDAESADCGEPRHHDNRLEVDFREPRIDLAARRLGDRRPGWVRAADRRRRSGLAAARDR